MEISNKIQSQTRWLVMYKKTAGGDESSLKYVLLGETNLIYSSTGATDPVFAKFEKIIILSFDNDISKNLIIMG